MRAPCKTHPRSPANGADSGQRGFTLIELLVAMALLAILASMSYRGLSASLEADAHVRSETRRWDDVSVAIAGLGRDLSLTIPRPVRDHSGRVRAAIAIGGPPDETQSQLLLTRLGDDDGAVSRSDLRRVGYRVRAGVLEYLIWPATDSAPDATPSISPVLENVTDLNFRALSEEGAWTTVWPGARPANSLPRAVEVQLVLAGGLRVIRLFPLR